ncbi:hypothetical protein AHAT_21600 [Agarivorans sp. Toyoura001]|uniref:DUF1145 domain-containing protein n=1 Tax=Agarivorans sp. Toyoura001 TaxID=2283141 RepID=UPI0010E3A89C|nr:DUF1145 domain-containing protein [Agarivorans sp. Toyoura001]GDY26270.1 hypothetical protein AHAT_21600 [Agarivorans sp. Toyoura001]
MFIKIGKAFMAAMWLAMLLSPMIFVPPYNWILPLVGAFLLLLHGVQLLAIRGTLIEAGVLQKGDNLRILFFGFFAMWQIHKRMKSKQP